MYGVMKERKAESICCRPQACFVCALPLTRLDISVNDFLRLPCKLHSCLGPTSRVHARRMMYIKYETGIKLRLDDDDQLIGAAAHQKLICSVFWPLADDPHLAVGHVHHARGQHQVHAAVISLHAFSNRKMILWLNKK